MTINVLEDGMILLALPLRGFLVPSASTHKSADSNAWRA